MKLRKAKMLVHFILDKSGSMTDILDATIKGFNDYVKELQKSEDNIRFSLTLFDSDSIDTVYKNVPIKSVKPLNKETYVPNAWTPLYDAVVDSVEELRESMKDKKTAVVVAIMTDGAENASKKHDDKCLKDLVHKLEHEGNWTFTFMGANQDSWAVAQKIGISAGNTMNWEANEKGTEKIFASYAMASGTYAKHLRSVPVGAAMNTADFFSGGDKKDDA